MIIDLILDRKAGKPYNPKDFYNSVMKYGEIGHDIAESMDSGGEFDVKYSLAKYIHDGYYNMEITEYIYSVNWLDDTLDNNIIK